MDGIHGETNYNMGITKDGIKGEQMLFKLLKDKGMKFFQPDAIAHKYGIYYVFETKHQERYTAPPFDGHGLPLWQVTARLKFQEATKVIAVFLVFDKETNEVFYQRLDELEKGEKYDTKGSKPRRIYPLSSYKKLLLDKCYKYDNI